MDNLEINDTTLRVERMVGVVFTSVRQVKAVDNGRPQQSNSARLMLGVVLTTVHFCPSGESS